MLACGPPGYLPDLYVGMKHGYFAFRHGLKGKVEQLAGDEEHRLAQLVELQVLLHLVRVEVVLGLAHLLRVVTVVPGLDGDVVLTVGDRLHVGDLLPYLPDCRGPYCLQELEGSPGLLRHPVCELPLGKIVKAQETHTFVAQRQDLGDDGVVVVLVAVVAAGVVGAPDLLAQLALVGEGQERVHGRPGIGHGVPAILPALACSRGGCLDVCVRQPR